MAEKGNKTDKNTGNRLENSAGLVPGTKEDRSSVKFICLDDHNRVISTCKDVPEEVPSFQIKLTEVGIAGKIVWVKLPEGRFPFDAEIYVNLPSGIRGIHMSRIEAVIANLYSQQFSDLRHYTSNLASLILDCQQGDRVRVIVRGKIPMIKRTSVSNRLSIDSLEISSETEGFFDYDLKKNVFNTTLGVGVSHMTACPCTQVYNQGLIECMTPSALPLPTHSQRSITWLYVMSKGDNPQYEELTMCLNNALHITSDLLKRPDEAEMVIKAHTYPQFVEDTAREVAKEVGKRFYDLLPSDTSIIIDSLSLESIHSRDVRCKLKTNLGEICSILEKEISA